MPMSTDTDQLYRMKAEVFKALGHPIRLKIIERLGDGEKTVTQLMEATGSEPSNTSRHLSVLKRAGIIRDRKEGLNVYYRLEIGCTLNFFSCVNDVLQQRLKQQGNLLELL